MERAADLVAVASSLPAWFWTTLFALLGLILGSFIATLCLRWPAGRSVVRGRSACDRCGHVLHTRDLVPVLSALYARGRCRICGARIAGFHTAVELAAGAIGALPFLFAAPPQAIGWALLGWLLLPLALLDARHLWLPNALTAALALGGLLAGPLLLPLAWSDRLIGGAAGFGSLWLIGALYRLLRGRDGLGGGDAKLLGALGLWFGWAMLPYLLLLASLLGLGAAIVLQATRGGVDRLTALPFGSCLAAAGWLLPAWWLAGPGSPALG